MSKTKVMASRCDSRGRPMSGHLVEVDRRAYWKITVVDIQDDGYYLSATNFDGRTHEYYVEGDLPAGFAH